MRRQQTHFWLCALSGIAALLTTSRCARNDGPEPPVAKPTVSISRPRAALGSPIDMTYRFVVAPTAPPLTGRHRAFVHFRDADGELMWTDDHDPPVPTTEWKPGQTIEYQRTVFVPVYPYLGDASVEVGLYVPGEDHRLPLEGQDVGQRSYRVATLHLLPQTENVFLIFKDGWHPAEVSDTDVAVEWQWTKKDATIAFRNLRRDALLYLHLDGNPSVFAEPQQVTVQVAGQTVDTFTIASPDEILRRIPLAVAQLGPDDMVQLQILVDKTFVPASIPSLKSRDPRELGVRLFHAFIEPR